MGLAAAPADGCCGLDCSDFSGDFFAPFRDLEVFSAAFSVGVFLPSSSLVEVLLFGGGVFGCRILNGVSSEGTLGTEKVSAEQESDAILSK